MRYDGLLLELELLKDIGLKTCLDLCDYKLVDIDLGEVSSGGNLRKAMKL